MAFVDKPGAKRKRYLLVKGYLADAFQAGEGYTMMTERSLGNADDVVTYLDQTVPQFLAELDAIDGLA